MWYYDTYYNIINYINLYQNINYVYIHILYLYNNYIQILVIIRLILWSKSYIYLYIKCYHMLGSDI